MQTLDQSAKLTQLSQEISSFMEKFDGNITIDHNLIQSIKDFQILKMRILSQYHRMWPS